MEGKTRSCNPAVAHRSRKNRGLVSIVVASDSGERSDGGAVVEIRGGRYRRRFVALQATAAWSERREQRMGAPSHSVVERLQLDSVRITHLISANIQRAVVLATAKKLSL